MRTLTRYAFTVGTLALLTGCGSLPSPIAPPGANSQAVPIATDAVAGKDLLYVADGTGAVEILTYPGGKRVGSISYGLYSYLRAECSDRSGNVWITDYNGVAEYAHGGTTAIKRKSFTWDLTGCSVDPKTNDLAVVAAGKTGTVFVWSSDHPKLRTYHTKSIYALRYCGYDENGNLFVDGVEQYNRDKFVLFELPADGSKLNMVSLDRKIGNAGQVQWDGRYMTIQDRDAPYHIYQIKISGSAGTVVNTIAFDGLRKPVEASWINGRDGFHTLQPWGAQR